jgi:hypothetical protein
MTPLTEQLLHYDHRGLNVPFYQLREAARRRRAIHEAGHAVAGWRQGYDSMVVIPENDPNKWPTAFCEWDLMDNQAKAVIYVAGYVAEWMDLNEDGSDFSELCTYIGKVFMEEDEADSAMEPALEALSEFCHFPWIGNRPYGRLLGDEFRSALDWLLSHTRQLLSAHWHLVELVAAEAITMGRVSTERIAELAASLRDSSGSL